MPQPIIQPNAAPIADSLVTTILRHACGAAAIPTFSVVHHGQYSNDLAEVHLRDGRRLMVKRGRHPSSRARFATARLAAGLLHERTGVVTPTSLALPEDLAALPVDAYWAIDTPTLADVWPGLDGNERRDVMRALGALIRRVHGVRTAGHGELPGALRHARSISQVLAEELGGRLMPAVAAGWPDARPLVELLMETIPAVARRAADGAVLLHGDVHMGNVLCARRHDGLRCVGLLDLECAHAGPRESDLARLAVLHTDLFQTPVEDAWLAGVLEGYGEDPDPLLLDFYSLYQLLHLGCHSAWLGHDVHARDVAASAREAAARLPGGWRAASADGVVATPGGALAGA